MKKIIWINSLELPIISQQRGLVSTVYGGWLDSLSRFLVDKYEMLFLYVDDIAGTKTQLNRFSSSESFGYNVGIGFFKTRFNEFNPDIIQIFGTETGHAGLAFEAAVHQGLEKKTIINLQCVTYALAYHYLAGIPQKISNRFGIAELQSKSNLSLERKRFINLGEIEKKMLKHAGVIQGRTNWDETATRLISKNANYIKCGEILRPEFYTGAWKSDKMERHSIFISQCSYPIKGFHFFLDSLPFIINRYPDLKVYTTGPNLCTKNKAEIRQFSSYRRFLRDKILKMGLAEKISFLGQLDASEMKSRYLKANVFVSPSVIENSPNSVGEAMLLGVPIVSSDVGGVRTMLEHGKEGFLYQYDAPYMLASYIIKIFDSDELASRIGTEAHQHALITHDVDSIINKQISIYENIDR